MASKEQIYKTHIESTKCNRDGSDGSRKVNCSGKPITSVNYLDYNHLLYLEYN